MNTTLGFELLRRLAAGGMGEVFIARKTGTGNFEKRLALKLLLPHLADSPEAVQRFHAEARLAARMNHPNIVEIFDVGEAEGRPFIAMQLVEGVSLDTYLRLAREDGLMTPLPIVRAIALGVCEALAYAHDLKDGKGQPLRLVHRDVTPSNVMVSYTGSVQLTDFGIARVGEIATSFGRVQGKAAYVAPEQLTLDAPLDARADIYTAALTIYELLTLHNPFRRRNQTDTFKAVLEGVIPPISQFRTDVSAEMEAALRCAFSPKPADRFRDATTFRKALIDGQVASGPDIAEHLRLRVPPLQTEEPTSPQGTKSQVLRVTQSLTVVDSQQNITTASMRAPDPAPQPMAAPGRWPIAAAILALVAIGGFGLGQLRDREAAPIVKVSPVDDVGTLTIEGPMDLTVEVDARPLEQPLSAPHVLPVGEHRVKATSGGRSQERVVSITKNADVRVSFSF